MPVAVQHYTSSNIGYANSPPSVYTNMQKENRKHLQIQETHFGTSCSSVPTLEKKIRHSLRMLYARWLVSLVLSPTRGWLTGCGLREKNKPKATMRGGDAEETGMRI